MQTHGCPDFSCPKEWSECPPLFTECQGPLTSFIVCVNIFDLLRRAQGQSRLKLQAMRLLTDLQAVLN